MIPLTNHHDSSRWVWVRIGYPKNWILHTEHRLSLVGKILAFSKIWPIFLLPIIRIHGAATYGAPWIHTSTMDPSWAIKPQKNAKPKG